MVEKLYEKELTVAKQIALQAGEIMKQYFFAIDQGLLRKADDTPVTLADTKINRLVIEELEKHFDDGVIGEEEATAEYGMGRKWFCDPIDGTKAFVVGIPTAMFSLALVVDGTPVLGVAYDPFLNMLYEGVVGGGSFCNGEKLAVSHKELAGEYVGVTSSIERVLTKAVQLDRLVAKKARLASFSGAVYKSALVTRGRLVGYLEDMLNAHDVASMEVIVHEAGGKVTGFKGEKLDYSKPFRGAIVSNGVVHDALVESVQ